LLSVSGTVGEGTAVCENSKRLCRSAG